MSGPQDPVAVTRRTELLQELGACSHLLVATRHRMDDIRIALGPFTGADHGTYVTAIERAAAREVISVLAHGPHLDDVINAVSRARALNMPAADIEVTIRGTRHEG